MRRSPTCFYGHVNLLLICQMDRWFAVALLQKTSFTWYNIDVLFSSPPCRRCAFSFPEFSCYLFGLHNVPRSGWILNLELGPGSDSHLD